MHLLVRDGHSLDETEAAQDLGQSPADLVFLSFADSELAAAASAWTATAEPKPTLRLANLGRLRHPFSVDLYLEQVAAKARAVLVRILGGLEYWRYGAEELATLCREKKIALALLPGDPANRGEAPEDPRLAALSTIAEPNLAKLAAYLRAGGPANLAHALQLLAHCAGLAPAPLALPAHGFACWPIFVHSLKDPAAARFLQSLFAAVRPTVILNATGFSARHEDAASPLDAAGVPVLQVVLEGSARAGRPIAHHGRLVQGGRGKFRGAGIHAPCAPAGTRGRCACRPARCGLGAPCRNPACGAPHCGDSAVLSRRRRPGRLCRRARYLCELGNDSRNFGRSRLLRRSVFRLRACFSALPSPARAVACAGGIRAPVCRPGGLAAGGSAARLGRSCRRAGVPERLVLLSPGPVRQHPRGDSAGAQHGGDAQSGLS